MMDRDLILGSISVFVLYKLFRLIWSLDEVETEEDDYDEEGDEFEPAAHDRYLSKLEELEAREEQLKQELKMIRRFKKGMGE